MGQAGDSLEWDDIEAATPKIKENALEHAIRSINEAKGRSGSSRTFGDETEYQLRKFNQERQKVKLLLKQSQALDSLNGEPFQPEFGALMVETNPKQPYENNIENLLDVETDMSNRRMKIQNQLKNDEAVMTLTAFPRLGAEIEERNVKSDLLNSLILLDKIVSDSYVTRQ